MGVVARAFLHGFNKWNGGKLMSLEMIVMISLVSAESRRFQDKANAWFSFVRYMYV